MRGVKSKPRRGKPSTSRSRVFGACNYNRRCWKHHRCASVDGFHRFFRNAIVGRWNPRRTLLLCLGSIGVVYDVRATRCSVRLHSIGLHSHVLIISDQFNDVRASEHPTEKDKQSDYQNTPAPVRTMRAWQPSRVHAPSPIHFDVYYCSKREAATH